jgi:hypothetical protein
MNSREYGWGTSGNIDIDRNNAVTAPLDQGGFSSILHWHSYNAPPPPHSPSKLPTSGAFGHLLKDDALYKIVRSLGPSST